MAKEKISEAIMSYPIPSYLKKQLKGRIEFTKTTSKESASVRRRIFRTGSLDLECGNVLELRELHSVASEEIQIVSKLAEGLWEGKISSIDGQAEIVQIIFMQTALREFVSTSLNLCVGHVYKLKEDGSQNWLNVQVEVEVAKGFWLGVMIEADIEEDEIVNIIYRQI